MAAPARIAQVLLLPLAAFYLLAAVPGLALAWLLLLHAATLPGRLFALATLAGLPAPVLLWLALYLQRRKAAVRVALGLGTLSLALLAWDHALTPDGRSDPGGRVLSVYAGTAAYHRASPANLVPEIDQLILGTYVVPHIDPLMDAVNTRELRRGVLDVYGAMRSDPAFERLGSVMDRTYGEIFLRRRGAGHWFVYLPECASTGRVPVLLFLHGSLGNFRGYLWTLKAAADAGGFAVVAPTFGAGNWDETGGLEAIEQARKYCAAEPRIDPGRIYLAGLSNGGIGVRIGASRHPEAYRGLLCISPVLDAGPLITPSFTQVWGRKPVLILHGSADNRIPVRFVRGAAASLRDAGVRAELRLYDGETHFLLFTRRAEICREIAAWIARDSNP